MCFSATGSFVISGLLTGLGATSLIRNGSEPTRKPYQMYAAIPFIFAAQQAAEGAVWLTMNSDRFQALHALAVTSFLGVAVVVWPLWLPFALRLIERNPARQKMLTALVGVGVVVSIYAGMFLARAHPVARIVGHSIRYDYPGSDHIPSHFIYLVAYALPTVVSFFVSTVALARTFGFMLVVSLLLASYVQREALASVWCFFAGILSSLIVMSMVREHRLLSPLPLERIAVP